MGERTSRSPSSCSGLSETSAFAVTAKQQNETEMLSLFTYPICLLLMSISGSKGTWFIVTFKSGLNCTTFRHLDRLKRSAVQGRQIRCPRILKGPEAWFQFACYTALLILQVSASFLSAEPALTVASPHFANSGEKRFRDSDEGCKNFPVEPLDRMNRIWPSAA